MQPDSWIKGKIRSVAAPVTGNKDIFWAQLQQQCSQPSNDALVFCNESFFEVMDVLHLDLKHLHNALIWCNESFEVMDALFWPKWRSNASFVSPNANFLTLYAGRRSPLLPNGDPCVIKFQFSDPSDVHMPIFSHQMTTYWPLKLAQGRHYFPNDDQWVTKCQFSDPSDVQMPVLRHQMPTFWPFKLAQGRHYCQKGDPCVTKCQFPDPNDVQMPVFLT